MEGLHSPKLFPLHDRFRKFRFNSMFHNKYLSIYRAKLGANNFTEYQLANRHIFPTTIINKIQNLNPNCNKIIVVHI